MYFRGFVMAALALGLAAVPASAHVTTRHFTSHMCPYSVDYPSGWKARKQAQYDDFARSGTEVQISCGAAHGLSVKAFVPGFAAELKKAGATVTRQGMDGTMGAIDGYWPAKVYGKAVYFEDRLRIEKGDYFLFQFVSPGKQTLRQNEKIFRSMLSSFRMR